VRALRVDDLRELEPGRSRLLRLGQRARAIGIDADRASPLTQAEKTTSAGLELTQVIYSERAHAGYDIARALYEAAKEGQRQAVLDTLYSAASAYLDLLRAESVESVRRSNVEHTRTNLATSRVREAVGLAERSDYLRWVAQLATDKQSLLAAESTRRQAETELMRVMHRPADQPFATVETGLDDPLTMISSPRAQSFIDTPAKWTVFSEYAVHTALEHAPEIGQAEAIIASNRRSVTAARRAYFVPDLALVSNGARTLSEGGAGAGSVPGGPDDDSWSVSLQATIPLFSGRRRTAELAQARDDLRAAEADRLATADSVEARTRSALHRTASSWPAIALAGQAAAAARENLRMVTDAYARGIVTVTDLIDAQDTALDADLAAADAKYGFLVDFVTVLRAMSEFDVLLDPGLREAWLDRVDQWFRDHEAASARQETRG
jgi:outer membrane protein TolC